MKFKLQLRYLGILIAITILTYCVLHVKEGFGATRDVLASTVNYVQVLGNTIMITAQAKDLPRNAFCLQEQQCGGGLKCKNADGVPITNAFINPSKLKNLVYGTCN